MRLLGETLADAKAREDAEKAADARAATEHFTFEVINGPQHG
jgi:hypothetical protein